MDSQVSQRAQRLRDHNRRRREVERYAPDLEELGVRYRVLTESERAELLALSTQWNHTSAVPPVRDDNELPSMGDLVAWLDAELPLTEIGEPNIAPVRLGGPFFRVQFESWDKIIDLVTRWAAVQVAVAGHESAGVFAGKNVAIEMPASYETHYAVRVDYMMF